MLDPLEVKDISDRCESICEKRFKRMGYRVEWLDRGKAKRMPEFLVSDGHGPVLVCEVKGVFAGRFLHDKNTHLSSLDNNLPIGEALKLSLDKSKIDEDLHDATGKYQRLLALRPALKKTPLVVAFFFDFYASNLSDYPTCMNSFPAVSGALTVIRDREIKEWAHNMTIEELRRRIDSYDSTGSPPNSKEFKLIKNRAANIRLPSHFVNRCYLGKFAI